MKERIELIKQKFWEGIDLIPNKFTIDRYEALTLIILLILFVLILAITVSHLLNKSRFEKEIRQISVDIINATKASTSIDKYIEQCLDILCPMLHAESYGFYLLDSKNDKYIIKSVRYAGNDLNEVGPSYSGLVPFKKEQYIQPISILNQDIPDSTTIITDGKVPILTLPLASKNALIRIYPVRKLSKTLKRKFYYFANIAGLSYDIISDTDTIKNKINNVVASDNAVNQAVYTLGTEDGLLYALIGLCIKKTGADSGFFIKKQGDSLKPLCFVSLPKDVETDIVDDTEGIKNLFSLSQKSEILYMTKGQPDYYKLPPYFTIYQIDSVAFLNVEENDKRVGTIIMLYKEGNPNQEFDTTKMKAGQYVKSRFQEIYGTQNVMKILSDSFQNTLQGLIQIIDNMQPYTVGYSELMARFSYIIAEELGLPEDEKSDIYQAASLSNIGVLGLSNEIFFKTGKYSDIEYEAMKFHAEAGARIIEASHGSKRIADYVRYHHERLYGMGYPVGLGGEEIPMGSRIISVVQFFLAKINGRQGRDPVTFNEALESLKMVVDTQLDKDCVYALIRWFDKKRRTSEKGHSLGYCWDMRCSNSEICMDCPVYMNKDVNCWEFEGKGIKCSEHGNVCKTCYIRTEVLGR
jgi:HD-GYP domain-containing protein (c-di-GMP phosphodiesterase class II)